MNKRRSLRRWLTLAAAIPLAWLIGILLLWGVYSLPEDLPMQHARESAHVFWEEETHRSWVVGGLPNVQVDNIADAYIIGMAANELDIGYSPLERALNPYFPLVPDAPYASSTHLAVYLNDPDQNYDVYYYGRYWSGFALMARLWLHLFTFPQIRLINLALQIMLALAACFFVGRELGWRGWIAVLIAYIALSPYTISLSMQYYPCFYLSFLGMIGVAVLHRRKVDIHAFEWLFLILGILTAYLDFLTYPAAVVGLPMVIWIALYPDAKKMFLSMLRLGVIWCVGYAGMWAGKWIMCAAANMSFTGGSVAERLSTHTGTGGDSLLKVILIPFLSISKKRLLLLSLPCAVTGGLGLLGFVQKKADWNRRFGYYVLLMLMPLVWVVFTRGHSVIHDFLSNRNLTVFFAAAFLMCSTMFPIPKKDQWR